MTTNVTNYDTALESGKKKLLELCAAMKDWDALKENVKYRDRQIPLSYTEFCAVNGEDFTVEENKQLWLDIFPERAEEVV